MSLKRENLPKTKHDDVAVNILEAIRSIAWSNSKIPFMAAPTIMAKIATMKAATVACTWTRATFPITICTISRAEFILPRFAWVDSRDARHISRLPLRPSRAGTRMNNSEIWMKTFQCCKRQFYFEPIKYFISFQLYLEHLGNCKIILKKRKKRNIDLVNVLQENQERQFSNTI